MKVSRHPPRLATWLLNRFGDRYRRDALVGDLLEQYHDGRSNGWYWRQVLCAALANGRGMLRSHRSGLIALLIWWSVLLGLSFESHWPVILFALDPSLYWLYPSKRRRQHEAHDTP